MSELEQAIENAKINTATQQDQLTEKDGKYKDWTYVEYNGRNVPFKKAQSIHTIWDRTIQHQKGHMWSGILLIGQSGSGKTTLVNGLIHYLHSKGHEYQIHRMSGDEINNMDKVIEKLAVGRKHLMFFDDASYSLGNLTSKQVDALKASLTTIRHKVQANVIGVFATHYTKALDKFFRSQAVMIFTSTSATEKSNLYELFRKDMNKISVFGKVYTKAVFYGWWDQTIDMFDGEVIRYKFSEPFRPVLVAFGDDVRACLVRKEECDICNPPPKSFKGMAGFDEKSLSTNPMKSISAVIEQTLKKGLSLERLEYLTGYHIWQKFDDKRYINKRDQAILNFYRALQTRAGDIPKEWWIGLRQEMKELKAIRSDMFHETLDMFEGQVSNDDKNRLYRELIANRQKAHREGIDPKEIEMRDGKWLQDELNKYRVKAGKEPLEHPQELPVHPKTRGRGRPKKSSAMKGFGVNGSGTDVNNVKDAPSAELIKKTDTALEKINNE